MTTQKTWVDEKHGKLFIENLKYFLFACCWCSGTGLAFEHIGREYHLESPNYSGLSIGDPGLRRSQLFSWHSTGIVQFAHWDSLLTVTISSLAAHPVGWQSTLADATWCCCWHYHPANLASCAILVNPENMDGLIALGVASVINALDEFKTGLSKGRQYMKFLYSVSSCSRHYPQLHLHWCKLQKHLHFIM